MTTITKCFKSLCFRLIIIRYRTLKQMEFKPSQNKTRLQWEHFGILFLWHAVRKGCVNITVKLTKLTKPFIVLQEISQSAVTKLSRKQECELVKWFCGLLACLTLCCDWSQHNKTNWNISSVPDFVGLTVTFTENSSAIAPGENLALNKLSLLEVFAVSTEPYIYIINPQKQKWQWTTAGSY